MRYLYSKHFFVKKLLFTLVLFILIAFATSMQGQIVIDSLKKELLIEKNDTSRIVILNQISRNYFGINPDSLLKYAKTALAESENINYLFGKFMAYESIGLYHYGRSEYTDAISSLKIAKKGFKEINKMKEYSNVFLILAATYTEKAEYQTAIKHNLQAIEIAKKVFDFLVLSPAYNNIGTIYMKLKDYDLALKYLNKSLKLKEKLNDKQHDVYTTSNIASYILQKKKMI